MDLQVHNAGKPPALSPECEKYVLVLLFVFVLNKIRGGSCDVLSWPGYSTNPRRVGAKVDMLEIRANHIYILRFINMSLKNAEGFTLAVPGLSPRGGGGGGGGGVWSYEVVVVAYVDAYFFYIRSHGETQGYTQNGGCIHGVHQNPNTAKVRTPLKRGHHQPSAPRIDAARQNIVLGAILRVCKMLTEARFDLGDIIRSKDYQNGRGLVHYDATKAMRLKFGYGCITAQKGGGTIYGYAE